MDSGMDDSELWGLSVEQLFKLAVHAQRAAQAGSPLNSPRPPGTPADMDGLRRQVAELRSQLQQAQGESAGRRALGQAIEEAARLQADKDRLEARLSQTEEDNKLWQAQIDQKIAATVNAIQLETQELEAQNLELRDKLEVAEQAGLAAEGELVDLRRRVVHLESQLEAGQQTQGGVGALEAMGSSPAQLKEAVATLEAQLERVRAELLGHEAEHLALERSELEHKVARADGVKCQLQASEGAVGAIRAQAEQGIAMAGRGGEKLKKSIADLELLLDRA